MNKTVLTAKQSELLEELIVKYGQIVTTKQIYAAAGDTTKTRQVQKLITKLVENGWLIRLKRGLYAISDFSSRGFLSLSPYVVANLLVKDSYVSFEAALAQHGMFDQLTGKVISVSLTAYKTVQLDSTEYSFVKTKTEFYFGWQEEIIGTSTARIATAEKALIDMVQFHKSRYSVDLVIEKLQEYERDLDMARFNDYLSKMSLVTIKVFGFIFDLLQIDSRRLYDQVRGKTGTHWMLSGDKKFNAKWRLYYDEYFDKYQRPAKGNYAYSPTA